MSSGANDFGTYHQEGVEQFMSFSPVNGTGWSIGLTAPKSDYFKDVEAMRARILVGTVLFIIIGIFLCFFTCKFMISKPIYTLVKISDEIALGNIDVSIEARAEDELGRLMLSFNKMLGNIKDQAYTAEKMAAGDLDIEVCEKSDKDVLGKSMKTVVNVLKDLVNETQLLTDAAQDGKLDVRGDGKKFYGGYAEIVEGINKTLDNVINPLTDGGEVLGRMAQNDFTQEMNGQYKGMMGEFAEKVNIVRSRFLSVQDVLVRVNHGDFSRLEEFQRIKRRSENDQLMPAVTGMMVTILELSKETNTVSEAVANGNLSLRGDTDKFEGEYRQVIVELNKALEAITAPLNEYAGVLGELEQGNLSVAAQGKYHGEYERIKMAINNTILSFNKVLSDINTSAEQVATGAIQVSDTSMALSQGATEQASTIEELTASIEEVASQIRLNADNANQSKELAEVARKNAILGNEKMAGMLKSIEDINNSSADISKIIKVIDEIAFQTNILALNAAVEAARAGQYGKGFAVVAEEVRNLAARSANAAKETTSLIESSIKKSEGGTKIAQATAEALEQIVSSIEKSAVFIGNIAVASNEQAVAIQQINQGVNQVSQVIQTNSATSQESAAASEELSSQADLLKEMVKRFKLADSFKAAEDVRSTDSRNSNIHRATRREMHAGFSGNPSIILSDYEFGKY